VDDPQQIWSRPHGVAEPGQPQMSQGNWWYQYPTGQWIWWSAEKNEWVAVEPKRVVPTPWWVYALIVLAVLIVTVAIVTAVSQVPELLEKQQRLENETNVLGS
jgi:hypothetical protein